MWHLRMDRKELDELESNIVFLAELADGARAKESLLSDDQL